MRQLFIQTIKDIFIISLITFIVFFFLDLIKQGFVINYVNINIVLLVCILSGIISVLVYDS